MNNRANTSSMGRRIMVIFLLIVIISGVWFMFLRTDGIGKAEASEMILGEWVRADGPYTIKILEVMDEGKLKADYYNPGPIHVEKATWRANDGELQIIIELQDKNYPGSTYELKCKDKGKLLGTYFQAVDKQTYKVDFVRK